MNEMHDLDGVTFARAIVEPNGKVRLDIMAPSGFAGKCYFPAESITFDDIQAVHSLRVVCDLMVAAARKAKSEEPTAIPEQNQVPFNPVPGSVTDFRLNSTDLGERI